VKCFCNARNTILNVQAIEIINAFCDWVSDIKTIEETTMKKPKTMTNLLAVVVVCIEDSEAWARILDVGNKGPSKKKQHEDREVNIVGYRN
jgi:hypothetical protein